MLQDKASHRAALRALRRQIPATHAAACAERAVKALVSDPAWKRAQTVGVYLDRDGEMPSQAFVQAARSAGKSLYLPVVRDDSVVFLLWNTEDELTPNRYGINEPPADAPQSERLDLLLLPLVGWAKSGYRLGMGGGYFDRYLANPKLRPRACLGLAFECQGDDGLEALREPWDEDIDGVLTEAGLRMFGARES
jgi:5-formyltetrahydrofolate cyclo-ligase